MLLPSKAATPISDADQIIKPLVDSVVVVEGLAWGERDKLLGERLTLPHGGEVIFLSDIDFGKKDLNGRLIRVVGKLTFRHQNFASQGCNFRFDSYRIAVLESTVIEKVTLEFPEKRNEGQANQALVPTPASVTPTADAPVAPATTAAHL